MKKYFKTLLFAILVFSSLISCSDFLDEQPISTIGINDFYKNNTQAKIALSGIYSKFADDKVYGQAMSIIMASGTDEGYYNRRYNENWTVGLYRHTPSDNYIKNLWISLYEIINLSNTFIEKLDASSFEPTAYNALIGEAKFLRAHAYQLLVDWWEEVPMPLTPTLDQSSNNLAVSSLEEIYAQIIEDYTFATQHLPAVGDPSYVLGRANKYAAHGLMARLYLKMATYPLKDVSKYELAKKHCDTIINSGIHGLSQSQTMIVNDGTEDKIIVTDDGYRKHFLNYIQNSYDTRESIFEISFRYLRESGIDTHGRIGAINGVPFSLGGGDDGYPGAYAMFNTTPILRNSYITNNDSIRRVWNLAEMKYSASGDASVTPNTLVQGYAPGKYRRWEPADYNDLYTTPEPGVIEPYISLEDNPTPNINFTTVNFPVIRYADVLLMYAEADNEISGGPTTNAIQYLNEVRNRAGLFPIETAKPAAISSKNNFFDELVDERFRELCFEGLRKHDLIRWKLLGEKLADLNASIEGAPEFSNTNEDHKAFLRSGLFFNPAKHMSLPYPLQEITLNKKLNQKNNW
ncbi:RagB/SusD family nutrient uptake outer membrane protein [Wenyingzhuangia sp. 1_MG-2023]|nr:RagB/SusD family nutrient uptake outer membrane protein [Wenyingzhuangia sp. 1_MG-2023]